MNWIPTWKKFSQNRNIWRRCNRKEKWLPPTPTGDSRVQLKTMFISLWWQPSDMHPLITSQMIISYLLAFFK